MEKSRGRGQADRRGAQGEAGGERQGEADQPWGHVVDIRVLGPALVLAGVQQIGPWRQQDCGLRQRESPLLQPLHQHDAHPAPSAVARQQDAVWGEAAQ